jgi:pSer/pThr/pTyr-binding forkhead associated (FHA) protein
MIKLILKFETHALKEVMFVGMPVVIGRTPDNDVQIDNLAVSTHHAHVFYEDNQLWVEDLDSLNGTFVNDQRVKRATLKDGDKITIGKHHIAVEVSGDIAATMVMPMESPRKIQAVPKVEETVVLTTKKQRDMIQQAARAPEAVPAPVASRARLGSLVVLRGKTDQNTYLLSSKLTVIGKSEMASVRLKGWFAPKAAAQINKREDGYYISMADRTPKVNGQPISRLTKLVDGDTIEVAGVKFSFVDSE